MKVIPFPSFTPSLIQSRLVTRSCIGSQGYNHSHSLKFGTLAGRFDHSRVNRLLLRLPLTLRRNMSSSSGATFYDLKAELPNGQAYDFEQLKGKVVLIVNVASKWYVCNHCRCYEHLFTSNQRLYPTI